jgi:hypothetical protein
MSYNVFGVEAGGAVLHKYWDGSAWNPSQSGWENLGGNATMLAASWQTDVQFNVLAANDGSGQPAAQHKGYRSAAPQAWLPLQQWETIGSSAYFPMGFPVIVDTGAPWTGLTSF